MLSSLTDRALVRSSSPCLLVQRNEPFWDEHQAYWYAVWVKACRIGKESIQISTCKRVGGTSSRRQRPTVLSLSRIATQEVLARITVCWEGISSLVRFRPDSHIQALGNTPLIERMYDRSTQTLHSVIDGSDKQDVAEGSSYPKPPKRLVVASLYNIS